jgi:hypothetical protein
VRRIGVLLPAAANDPDYQAWFGAFLEALAQSGWTIGADRYPLELQSRWQLERAGLSSSAAGIIKQFRRSKIP